MIHDTQSALQSKVLHDSVVYTDSYRCYHVLNVSAFKHYRIKDSKPFSYKDNHIKVMENFGNEAKRVLCKYNGIPCTNRHVRLDLTMGHASSRY